ncbi:MAG: C40 family peptidase [Muribaculaceae bacterium]|nr:C40 family peptidase [Muribaculaceae bacterium]
MKIQRLVVILALSVGFLNVYAQTKSSNNIHQKAHAQLLAKAKSGMDKSVIKDFVKQDVLKRETSVERKNVASDEVNVMVADLLKEAKKHIGKRYRSGSKGPDAFDCSGFAGYVYRQFGYSLGASSRDQYLQGEKIDKNSLRKGDLVFFTGRNSRSNTVGHVGIVVSADNENGTFTFIHASTSQGVRIDTNTGYYAHRYVGAKRIITD